MTAKKAKDLKSAADSLLEAMEKQKDINATLYRTHIQTLIEADFVNLTFNVGNVGLTWIGKNSTTNAFHLLVSDILRIVSQDPTGDESQAYQGTKNAKTKDPAIA